MHLSLHILVLKPLSFTALSTSVCVCVGGTRLRVNSFTNLHMQACVCPTARGLQVTSSLFQLLGVSLSESVLRAVPQGIGRAP